MDRQTDRTELQCLSNVHKLKKRRERERVAIVGVLFLVSGSTRKANVMLL